MGTAGPPMKHAASPVSVQPLAHSRAEVAAGILAVMQLAHEQEGRWLQLAHVPPLLETVPAIQASTRFHLGAVRGDEIVGVLVVAPDDEPGQLSIATLVVHPGVQRQGVARRLVQDALARGPGVVFSVSAATANTAAMALYRGLGFVPYRQGVLGPASLPITKLRRLAAPAEPQPGPDPAAADPD
jgi:ribosomal protein S18 acetylase RimI-like enzyme